MRWQQKVTWRYSATAPLCWPLSFLADWSPTCDSITLRLTTDQVDPFRFALVWRVEGKKMEHIWGGCKENLPSNALLSCHCTPREGARSRNLLATRRPISSRPPPCICSTSQEGTRLAWETIPPPALGTDFGATAAVADVVVVSQVNVEN